MQQTRRPARRRLGIETLEPRRVLNGAVETLAVNIAPSFTKGADPLVLEDAGPQSIANWATDISPGDASADFFAYEADYRGGVTVGVTETDGVNGAEIIVGHGPRPDGQVRVFKANGALVDEIEAFPGFDGATYVSGSAYAIRGPGSDGDGYFGLVVTSYDSNSIGSVVITNDYYFEQATPITDADVDSLRTAVIERWVQAGLDPRIARLFHFVEIELTNFSGSELGRIEDNDILLDLNGGGRGWFVDPTPLLDEEYDLMPNGDLVAPNLGPDGGDFAVVVSNGTSVALSDTLILPSDSFPLPDGTADLLPDDTVDLLSGDADESSDTGDAPEDAPNGDAKRIDLLTALVHHFGELLGVTTFDNEPLRRGSFSDLSGDLMKRTLPAGVRRPVNADHVDAIFADSE